MYSSVSTSSGTKRKYVIYFIKYERENGRFGFEDKTSLKSTKSPPKKLIQLNVLQLREGFLPQV